MQQLKQQEEDNRNWAWYFGWTVNFWMVTKSDRSARKKYNQQR